MAQAAKQKEVEDTRNNLRDEIIDIVRKEGE